MNAWEFFDKNILILSFLFLALIGSWIFAIVAALKAHFKESIFVSNPKRKIGFRHGNQE